MASSPITQIDITDNLLHLIAMKVTFNHSRDEAPNIRTFVFTTEQAVPYSAGQFVQLTIPHDNADERGIKHWFTLSSAPSDQFLSITTKHATEHSSTFKRALFDLRAGEVVTMSDPMGDFVLPKDENIPLVFIAGGIGITPFHSMFKWLSAAKKRRNIRLLYGVRNENEIIFQDTFERANQHVTIVVSEPSRSWGGERGRLTAQKIIGLVEPSNEQTLFYFSGPEPMIEALSKDFAKQGVAKNQIVTDFFPGYSTF
jgi:ferredoxin-NADP reductase